MAANPGAASNMEHAVQYIRQFLESECGAVTIDWVVLTAGIALIGGGIVARLADETADVSNSTAVAIEGHSSSILNP